MDDVSWPAQSRMLSNFKPLWMWHFSKATIFTYIFTFSVFISYLRVKCFQCGGSMFSQQALMSKPWWGRWQGDASSESPLKASVNCFWRGTRVAAVCRSCFWVWHLSELDFIIISDDQTYFLINIKHMRLPVSCVSNAAMDCRLKVKTH